MTPDDEIHSSEDEAVASDLDMHALILGGLHQDHECPVKTADEVTLLKIYNVEQEFISQLFALLLQENKWNGWEGAGQTNSI